MNTQVSLEDIQRWLKAFPEFRENAVLDYIYEIKTRPEREWVEPALEKERERIWTAVCKLAEASKGTVPMVAIQDVKGVIYDKERNGTGTGEVEEQ